EGSVVGTLERMELDNLPGNRWRYRATIRDSTGVVNAVWLRGGMWRTGVNAGESIALSGRLMLQGRQLVFENPDYERADGTPIHTRRLVPVHPLTAGLTERELRSRVHWALTNFATLVEESLPDPVRTQHSLGPIAECLWAMHFPNTLDEYARARRRFA